MKRKKVLVVSSKRPFPVCDGAAIRTMQMIRMLARICDVDLVYTCNRSLSPADEREVQSLCGEVHAFPEPKWKMILRGLSAILGSKPMQCSYFYSPAMRRFIDGRIGGYDFIFCNNIRTAPYAEGHACGKIIDYVDAISMNYIGASRKAGLLWRLIYRLEADRLIRYEQHVLRSFDRHFIISDVDRQFILSRAEEPKKIGVVNNCTAFDEECIDQPENQDIVFVGSMYYAPNIVAVTTFVRNVFPAILQQEPQTRFFIVGSRPAPAVAKLASDRVIVTGFVEEPKEYLRKAAVVVVPMYSGAGVQNKILEAMSIGCCVVTTRTGAEGLDGIVDGKEIFIRTDYREMADTVVALMRNRRLRGEVGKAAKNYIGSRLTFESVYHSFSDQLGPI